MGQRAAGTERIYLSDVEPHAAAPIDRASDLRSRVLLHVLFADTLLIGDSQGLNNRYFRALVDAEEARKVRWSPGTAALSDFGALLEAGRLRVALRAGGTLHRISDGHRAEGVENAPDVPYVERLTGVSSAHTVPYDGSAVAAAFKSGVLTRIEAAERDFAGSAREALEAARAWVSEQDPLLYKQLRDWLADYRSARPGAAPNSSSCSSRWTTGPASPTGGRCRRPWASAWPARATARAPSRSSGAGDSSSTRGSRR